MQEMQVGQRELKKVTSSLLVQPKDALHRVHLGKDLGKNGCLIAAHH